MINEGNLHLQKKQKCNDDFIYLFINKLQNNRKIKTSFFDHSKNC